MKKTLLDSAMPAALCHTSGHVRSYAKFAKRALDVHETKDRVMLLLPTCIAQAVYRMVTPSSTETLKAS